MLPRLCRLVAGNAGLEATRRAAKYWNPAWGSARRRLSFYQKLEPTPGCCLAGLARWATLFRRRRPRQLQFEPEALRSPTPLSLAPIFSREGQERSSRELPRLDCPSFDSLLDDPGRRRKDRRSGARPPPRAASPPLRVASPPRRYASQQLAAASPRPSAASPRSAGIRGRRGVDCWTPHIKLLVLDMCLMNFALCAVCRTCRS